MGEFMSDHPNGDYNVYMLMLMLKLIFLLNEFKFAHLLLDMMLMLMLMLMLMFLLNESKFAYLLLVMMFGYVTGWVTAIYLHTR